MNSYDAIVNAKVLTIADGLDMEVSRVCAIAEASCDMLNRLFQTTVRIQSNSSKYCMQAYSKQ